jgi:hypothetical protein
LNLLVRGGRFEVEKCFDISAHSYFPDEQNDISASSDLGCPAQIEAGLNTGLTGCI